MIYRKTTQTDLIIPANSNHPWQHKMASFHSMVNRLVKIPMNKKDFDNERNIIKCLAIRNGYKHNLVDKLINRAQLKKKQEVIPDNIQNKEFLCVPYSSILNKPIRKTFEGSNYKMSYKTRNNSFKLIQKFSNNRQDQQEDKFDKAGIYKIKCKECPKYYIGQTGRSFSCRYKEHIQAIKSNNRTTQRSMFAEHILNSDHQYGKLEECMDVLGYETKGEKMNAKEELHIYLNSKTDNNILNKMQIQKLNPIYEKIREFRNNRQQI